MSLGIGRKHPLFSVLNASQELVRSLFISYSNRIEGPSWAVFAVDTPESFDDTFSTSFDNRNSETFSSGLRQAFANEFNQLRLTPFY